jgi:uncharacterized protein YjbI with pentapeptide repeats
MKCLNKRYKNVLKIDPKMKNPTSWKKVKKTESNLGMYMNQINTNKSTKKNSSLDDELLSKKIICNKLINDDKLSNKVFSDKELINKILSDKVLSNKLLSDKEFSNKLLSDKVLNNIPLSDKELSNRLLSDKILSDETILFNMDDDQLSIKYSIPNSIWLIIIKYVFVCTGINLNVFNN